MRAIYYVKGTIIYSVREKSVLKMRNVNLVPGTYITTNKRSTLINILCTYLQYVKPAYPRAQNGDDAYVVEY